MVHANDSGMQMHGIEPAGAHAASSGRVALKSVARGCSSPKRAQEHKPGRRLHGRSCDQWLVFFGSAPNGLARRDFVGRKAFRKCDKFGQIGVGQCFIVS